MTLCIEQGYSTVLYAKAPCSKEKTADGRVEAHLVALRALNRPKVTVPGLQLLADHMVRLKDIIQKHHMN